MADPLDELRAQRELVARHLAWLDRQIAAGGSKQPAAAQTADGSVPSVPVPSSAFATSDPDELLARYQQPPAKLKEDVRKGCLLYFFLALTAVALFVAAFWFWHSRPLLRH